MEDTAYNTYTLDKFLIMFDTHIKYETYSCKDYYGIIFNTDKGKFDIIHNHAMGNRILINDLVGGWKDIPLKEETFWLLPEGVRAIEI